MNSLWFPFFIALLAILNPVGASPLFLTYAERQKTEVVRILAGFVSISVFISLLVFLLSGPMMLRFFGISIPAFQIAGGLLIFIRSLQMMNGTLPHIEVLEEKTKKKISSYQTAIHLLPNIIVPIVIPVFIGPGTITTLILYAQEMNGIGDLPPLIFGALMASVVVYIVLLLSQVIMKVLGNNGLQVVMRVLGLILAAIGVQFIINGVQLVL